MKFLKLFPLFCFLLSAFGSYGADLKLSALPSITNVGINDLFLVSAFSGGATNSKSVTLNNLNQSLLSLGQQGPYILETNGTARNLTLVGPVNMATIVRVTNSVTGEWWDFAATGTNAFTRLKDLTNAIAGLVLTGITNTQSGVTLTGTFIGSGAGLTNLTFGNFSVGTNHNTIYGLEAGTNITTGDFNTFVGYRAGRTNNIGSFNTYIGAFAGGSDDKQNAGTNNVYIGYSSGFFFWTGVGQSNLLNHFIAGSSGNPYTNVYFGNGYGSDGSADNYVINGSGVIGANLPGGDIGVAGGRGTGTGTPGSVYLKTPIASAAVSTNQQALSNRVSIAGGTGLMTVYNDFQLNGVASGGNLVLTNEEQSLTGRKILQDVGSYILNLGSISGTNMIPWSTNDIQLVATQAVVLQFSGSAPPFGKRFTRTIWFSENSVGGFTLTVGTNVTGISTNASAQTTVWVSTLDGGTNLLVSWDSGSASGSLADPGADGILARTALDTTTARTVTGTASQIAVANGTGVSGNPTISLTSTVAVTSALTIGGANVVGTGIPPFVAETGGISTSQILTTPSLVLPTISDTVRWVDLVELTNASTGQRFMFQGTGGTNDVVRKGELTNAITGSVNATNVLINAGVLSAASAQTNYVVPLLSGVGGNLLSIFTENTNCFITFTGTNVADTTRTVMFRAMTNNVVVTVFFGQQVLTNYNFSNYVTNGWRAVMNFYNPDSSGTNLMVSDAGRYR